MEEKLSWARLVALMEELRKGFNSLVRIPEIRYYRTGIIWFHIGSSAGGHPYRWEGASVY
jgi:hypothetical protein